MWFCWSLRLLCDDDESTSTSCFLLLANDDDQESIEDHRPIESILVSSSDCAIMKTPKVFASAVVLLCCDLLPSANGFVPPSHWKAPSVQPPVKTSTVLPNSILGDAIARSRDNEESRKYRRTVYTFEDWPKHRSPDRFWTSLRTFFVSRINRGLLKNVFIFMCISTFVVAWNCLAAGYKDLSGFSHPAVVPWLPVLSIPMTAFSLTSTSVGLLLGEFFLVEALILLFLFLSLT